MKFKSIIVFLVIVILFLLAGCQGESEVPTEAKSAITNLENTEVKSAITNWEYTEVIILCNLSKPECMNTSSGSDKLYPSRVSILNEFGELGWEVVGQFPDGYSIYYLLKRPLLP